MATLPLIPGPQGRLQIADQNGNPTNYYIRFMESICNAINGTLGAVPGVNRVTLGTGINHFAGSGSPEGVVPANMGDLYSNTAGGSGTALYVKATGASGTSTGWTALS